MAGGWVGVGGGGVRIKEVPFTFIPRPLCQDYN